MRPTTGRLLANNRYVICQSNQEIGLIVIWFNLLISTVNGISSSFESDCIVSVLLLRCWLCRAILYKRQTFTTLQKYKTHICLFMCFINEDINLKSVNDLTANSSLASLKWFISRREIIQYTLTMQLILQELIKYVRFKKYFWKYLLTGYLQEYGQGNISPYIICRCRPSNQIRGSVIIAYLVCSKIIANFKFPRVTYFRFSTFVALCWYSYPSLMPTSSVLLTVQLIFDSYFAWTCFCSSSIFAYSKKWVKESVSKFQGGTVNKEYYLQVMRYARSNPQETSGFVEELKLAFALW